MKLAQSTKIAVAIAALGLALPAAAQQVTLMTGPQGGSWVPLGGALKVMWEQAVPGLQIQQTPGAGIANVRGVDEGKAQIGFANSSTTVDGIAGRAPYPKKVTKVCQVANLYPQYFQVVALSDAKINSFADMKGKALVTQPKGNTAEILTDMAAPAAMLRLLQGGHGSAGKRLFPLFDERGGFTLHLLPKAGHQVLGQPGRGRGGLGHAPWRHQGHRDPAVLCRVVRGSPARSAMNPSSLVHTF